MLQNERGQAVLMWSEEYLDSKSVTKIVPYPSFECMSMTIFHASILFH